MDERLVGYNKLQMRKILAEAVRQYNETVSEIVERDRKSGDEVVVARPVLKTEDFQVVWGYHLDIQTKTVGQTKIHNEIYTNLIVGFSEKLEILMIAKTNREFTGVGEVRAWGRRDFLRGTYNWFADQYTIFDKNRNKLDAMMVILSKGRKLSFRVPRRTDFSIVTGEGEPILAYMDQPEGVAAFKKFWKGFVRK